MTQRWIAAVGIWSILVASPLRADLIGTGTLSTDESFDLSFTSFQLGLFDGVDGDDVPVGPYLTSGPITDSSDGAVFTFDSLSPNYASVVSALTNGSLDAFRLAIIVSGTPESSVWDYENVVFLGSPGLGLIDFAGHTIDQITLTIDHVSISEPDLQTHVTYEATVRLYEQAIPAPGAAVLGLIGLVLVGRRMH